MKKLWAIFAMLFVFVLASDPAEARKFGAGKSFGKSYQTAPAPAARPAPTQQQSAMPGSQVKKGLLGGLMGGLLAGGLIAALFGGAFQGLQFMDILIMAAIAFVIFKLFRSRAAASQPAYAGSGLSTGNPATPQTAQRKTFDLGQPAAAPVVSGQGFGASSVPFNLPDGFDLTGFLVGAREHYRTVQDAWNKNDLAKIREYVSSELFDDLQAERATLPGDQHTEVLFVDAECVRADQSPGKAEISLKFSGRYRDTVENIEEPITDLWHLERDLTQPNAPWLIVGIEV